MQISKCLLALAVLGAPLFAGETKGLVFAKNSYYVRLPGHENSMRKEDMQFVEITDQMWAQFYLEPTDFAAIEKEQPATVCIPALDNAQFVGKVGFIDPRIDVVSGCYRIKVLLDNPDHKIKTGMRATADFTRDGAKAK